MPACRRSSIAALSLALLLADAGLAEEAQAPPPANGASPVPAPDPASAEPVFLRLKPEAKLEHRAEAGCWVGTGGVVMRRGGATLTAGQIVYWEREGTAYAEGTVVFEDADRRIFADRGWYSWDTRQGRLERGRVIRHDPARGIHYYLQAASIDLDGSRSVFHDVTLTTCSFADPHYAWHADEMVLTEGGGPGLGKVVSRTNILNIGGVTVGYLPVWRHDLGHTYFPLRETKAGRENDLGDYLRTTWGLPVWEEGNLSAHVDYFGRHGFGGGPAADWSSWDQGHDAEGRILAYGINDRGKDPGDLPVETTHRGWLYAVDHRFHGNGWSSLVEASKLSDPRFLPLYFEKESRTGKEQETRVHVQHVQGEYAQSFGVQPRLNDFQTQTEYLPRADVRVLSKSFLDGRVLWNAKTEVASLQRRHSDLVNAGPDHSALRADTRQEAVFPFPVGPFHAQAFVDERATWFSETAESEVDKVRMIHGGGMRVGTQFLKPLDTTSEFWNIRAMRHIVVPQVEYRTAYDSTIRNDRLHQFDSVDAADRFERVTFSLGNIWQARRRPAVRQETDLSEAEPPPLVTGDFATLDLRMHYFPVPHRDNADHPWSPLEGKFRIVPRDYLAAYTDWTYNPEVSDGVETWNVGVTINPDYAEAFGADRFGRARFSARALETDASASPPKLGSLSDRWSLNLENRYVKGDSSTLNGTLTYVLSERWSAGIEQEYQWLPGHRGDQKLLLRRDLHEWVMEFSIGRDANHGANLLFLVYPKGLF